MARIVVIDRAGDARAHLAGVPLTFTRGRAQARRASGILFVTGSSVTVQVTSSRISFSIAGNGRARFLGRARTGSTPIRRRAGRGPGSRSLPPPPRSEGRSDETQEASHRRRGGAAGPPGDRRGGQGDRAGRQQRSRGGGPRSGHDDRQGPPRRRQGHLQLRGLRRHRPERLRRRAGARPLEPRRAGEDPGRLRGDEDLEGRAVDALHRHGDAHPRRGGVQGHRGRQVHGRRRPDRRQRGDGHRAGGRSWRDHPEGRCTRLVQGQPAHRADDRSDVGGPLRPRRPRVVARQARHAQGHGPGHAHRVPRREAGQGREPQGLALDGALRLVALEPVDPRRDVADQRTGRRHGGHLHDHRPRPGLGPLGGEGPGRDAPRRAPTTTPLSDGSVVYTGLTVREGHPVGHRVPDEGARDQDRRLLHPDRRARWRAASCAAAAASTPARRRTCTPAATAACGCCCSRSPPVAAAVK